MSSSIENLHPGQWILISHPTEEVPEACKYPLMVLANKMNELHCCISLMDVKGRVIDYCSSMGNFGNELIPAGRTVTVISDYTAKKILDDKYKIEKKSFPVTTGVASKIAKQRHIAKL